MTWKIEIAFKSHNSSNSVIDSKKRFRFWKHQFRKHHTIPDITIVKEDRNFLKNFFVSEKNTTFFGIVRDATTNRQVHAGLSALAELQFPGHSLSATDKQRKLTRNSMKFATNLVASELRHVCRELFADKLPSTRKWRKKNTL